MSSATRKPARPARPPARPKRPPSTASDCDRLDEISRDAMAAGDPPASSSSPALSRGNRR